MFNVIKANGQIEPFSEVKLLHSAQRAGIPEELTPDVLTLIKQKLHNNITTAEIYHEILEFLDAAHHHNSKVRYSLKQSIMDLGPTGYPFEDYVAKVLEAQGYTTATRNIVRGKCISHEIDVIAEKQREGHKFERMMVEAKYHNRLGVKTEVHVAMYTKSRFEDVREMNNFTNVLLITNTKATTDAISYALCVGMKIISWSYPEREGLREIVEKYGLHPITSLNSLSLDEKQLLMKQGIVLCKDLCKNEHIIDMLNEQPEKKKKILDEALYICSIEKK